MGYRSDSIAISRDMGPISRSMTRGRSRRHEENTYMQTPVHLYREEFWKSTQKITDTENHLENPPERIQIQKQFKN